MTAQETNPNNTQVGSISTETIDRGTVKEKVGGIFRKSKSDKAEQENENGKLSAKSTQTVSKNESKQADSAKIAKSTTFRIQGKLQKKLADIVAKANANKPGKKRIRSLTVIDFALDLIGVEHISELRSKSLTNSERLHLLHRGYKQSHGEVSFEEFLGKVVSGQLANSKKIKQYLNDGFNDETH
jgi:hypothetical protein